MPDILRTLNRPLTWAVAALVAAGAAGATLVVRGGEPDPLAELRRAREAAEEAGGHSARIAASLERIAANLRRGSDIPEQSAEIQRLTAAQRRSLEGLVDLLRGQIDALDRSAGLVEETEESAEDLAALSARQARMLQRAVAALRSLEEIAARAGATSADLAHAARYAARLARDSQESFSRP